jgi:hypothetical protein
LVETILTAGSDTPGRRADVKFHELPVGASFRFLRRGLLLTKTGDHTYVSEQAGMHQAAAPDSEVLSEDFAIPEPSKAAGCTPTDMEIRTGRRRASSAPTRGSST